MTHLSVPSKRKRLPLVHYREQLIYYMGEIVNNSSSSLAPLKNIVNSKEFEGLLTLLSGVGTQRVIKLLESASRNCAAKKAERAEKKNARKGADAISDRPGSTKRPKMHKTGHSGPFSPSDNESTSRVKIEFEDSASRSIDTNGKSTRGSGQAEDEQISSRKRPQSPDENGDETTSIGTAPSEALISKRKALHLESWDMYEMEVGIIRRDPKVIAPIEDHCCTTLVNASKFRSGDPKKEVGQLLSDIEQLDFLFAKDRLIKYLSNRQAKMGMQMETPATWTMSEPHQVLGALRTIRTICDDAHIHRAFGQMKLCLLVQQKLKSGHTPISSGKGKSRLPETNYLEELARGEAGLVSEDEIEAKHRDYLSEYQAGKRWLQVADWFGGPGIVLVFITAGIGSFHVAAGWKVFQRLCLEYISKSLYSIKGLVGTLGTDCLEKYCRYGHLPQNYINKVIEYEGIIPAEEIDEDGSEADEMEEDGSGTEVDYAKEENDNEISDSDTESGSASHYDDDSSEDGQDLVVPEENADMAD